MWWCEVTMRIAVDNAPHPCPSPSEGRGNKGEGGLGGLRNWFIATAVLILCLFVTSCGYRFAPAGGIVPQGAKTIAVPVFLNGTYEPFVDTEVTRAVVDEFLTDGRLKVVSLEGADLILRGKVTKFELSALSYTADSRVQQYRIALSVEVSLEEAKSRKLLWQEKGLGSAFVSSYTVTIGEITATKTAKETAIRNASRDIAASIRSRVLEGF